MNNNRKTIVVQTLITPMILWLNRGIRVNRSEARLSTNCWHLIILKLKEAALTFEVGPAWAKAIT